MAKDKIFRNTAIGIILILMIIFGNSFLKINEKIPVSGPAALQLQGIIEDIVASSNGRVDLESCHRVGQKFISIICGTKNLQRELLEKKLTADKWEFTRRGQSSAHPDVRHYSRGNDHLSFEGEVSGDVQIVSVRRNY